LLLICAMTTSDQGEHQDGGTCGEGLGIQRHG
jgi:hypothetical protein